MEEAEDRLCRFCFGEEEDGAGGTLISPCNCTGGQKWVHLNCLRKWQRSVLVTQPTHPMFWEDDARQKFCNVCTAQFTCNPPTRHELMRGFTGEELAGLLEEGCLITASPQFSRDLRRQMQGFSPTMMEASNYLHWMEQTYLITEINYEPEQAKFKVISETARQDLITLLRESGSSDVKINGKRFAIVREGPLAGDSDLLESIGALPIGTEIDMICMRSQEPGQETVIAVNLTRMYDPLPFHLKNETERAYHGRKVHLVHFNGGPCADEDCVCIVPRVFGPVTEQWTISPNGQWMVTKSLKTALELFPEESRSLKRSRSEMENESKDDDVAEPEAVPVTTQILPIICVYWGDARWSRTQLLGELAKGSWGMCRGNTSDAIPPENSSLSEFEAFRKGLTKTIIDAERLFYAPQSEMTEHHPSAPISEEEERALENRMNEYRQSREARMQQHDRALLNVFAPDLTVDLHWVMHPIHQRLMELRAQSRRLDELEGRRDGEGSGSSSSDGRSNDELSDGELDSIISFSRPWNWSQEVLQGIDINTINNALAEETRAEESRTNIEGGEESITSIEEGEPKAEEETSNVEARGEEETSGSMNNVEEEPRANIEEPIAADLPTPVAVDPILESEDTDSIAKRRKVGD